MGILYFGDDLSRPSVLWMRRMLEGLGDDVAVLVTETDPGPDYASRYRTVVVRDGASLALWRILRRLGVVESIARTSKAVRQFLVALESDRVTAVLVHYITSAVAFRKVWQRSRKPVFVHCHGWDVTWNMREGPPPGERVHDRDYERRVRELPDHVHFIANSLRTAERLRFVGIDDSRIHLKYLGVPVPKTLPERCYKAGEVTILYLGRLVDFKGPEVVIEAFSTACDRGLRGSLVLAGDGPSRAVCESARRRSAYADRIELLGAVDGATGERLRAKADIFTAHNRVGPESGQEEAFGVSIAEAMAAGIPVVTGSNGSLPEVVENGIQGILFEPGDVEAHADAFLKLADDPELRRAMGRAGWEHARNNFALEREISTLRSILGLDP
jgi:colanic acid/amylovoran biosynthesis glycosyltransferase